MGLVKAGAPPASKTSSISQSFQKSPTSVTFKNNLQTEAPYLYLETLAWGGGGLVWLTTIKKSAKMLYTALNALLKIPRLPTSSITPAKKWTVWMHIYKFLCFLQVITCSQTRKKSQKKIHSILIQNLNMICFNYQDATMFFLGR